MKIHSSYKIKIKGCSSVFDETVSLYRKAVDFFINVILSRWETDFSICKNQSDVIRLAERLCHSTAKRPFVDFDFSKDFYKFPSYLRRAAIVQAFGDVSSYQTRLQLWQKHRQGQAPGMLRVGHVFPAMYRDNMFRRTGRETARVKVFVRHTWDWIDIGLRKTDVDYIARYCSTRKECVPILRKRGKNWFLEFGFEESVKLSDTPIEQQRIVAVDLGINNACVCSVMNADGTILARRFLRLSQEQDRLKRSLDRIKQAQRHGARKMPRLWALCKGINDDISVKTARFIMDVAVLYEADTIVIEKLELRGKKRGGKRQRLHHWRAQYVQQMVEHKAHRCGMRIRRVNAWNTSRLAFDGSGMVERDAKNYSLCTFVNGKRYHADLNASYNIGARYFVRELFKTLTVTQGQHISAKVPECVKRSTCTLSSLIRLHTEMRSFRTALV